MFMTISSTELMIFVTLAFIFGILTGGSVASAAYAIKMARSKLKEAEPWS